MMMKIDDLVYIADNSKATAAAKAKGILEFAYGYPNCNCPPESDTSTMKNSAISPVNGTGTGLIVEATPNPARTWVAFNYKLPVYAYKAELQITDITGKYITTFKLTASQGQQVWDIRGMDKGVYIYTLRAANVSTSGKLIIQ